MELHPTDNIIETSFVLLFLKYSSYSKTLTPKSFRNKSCACSQKHAECGMYVHHYLFFKEWKSFTTNILKLIINLLIYLVHAFLKDYLSFIKLNHLAIVKALNK